MTFRKALFPSFVLLALPLLARAAPDDSGDGLAGAGDRAREIVRTLAERLPELVREERFVEAEATARALAETAALVRRLDELAATAGRSSAADGLTSFRPAEPEVVDPAARAIERALAWLAAGQREDGSWPAGRAEYDVGVTALATLALIEAGPAPRRSGRPNAVRRAVQWLLDQQDEEGCFGTRTSTRFVYNHALATAAVAEEAIRSGSPFLRESVEQAAAFIEAARNPERAWRYGVRTNENDTSVSGAMLLALDAARRAGVAVDRRAYEGVRTWLDEVTDPESGRVGYTSRGSLPARPTDRVEEFPPWKSESLTAVGILCRILVGETPGESEAIRKGTELCLARLPEWDPEGGSVDMYYWYHGTLALSRVGGDAWRRWREAAREAALSGQRTEGDHAGSWDPVGPWGSDGGRVYSTALLTIVLHGTNGARGIFAMR